MVAHKRDYETKTISIRKSTHDALKCLISPNTPTLMDAVRLKVEGKYPEVPCSKYGYIQCAECGSSVYESLALYETGERFCSHKCIREAQQNRKKIVGENL